MEKFNLEFNDKFSVAKSILWIISLLSWLLFLCTGWASIKYFVDEKYEIIWTIEKMGKVIDGKYTVESYYPIQMNTVIIYIAFLIVMIFGFAAFGMYIYKSIISKDEDIFNGMMGIWPRLHSFPLIIVSFLFLLGEYFHPYYLDKYYDPNLKDFTDYATYYNRMKDIRIFGLAFSIIGLISLIFIYIVTDLNTDKWYVVLTIKKGFYSCLIILLWYYFCYMVFQISDYMHPSLSKDKTVSLRKTLGIGFSIIVGLGSLIFSFIFKDIIASFMNIIIYIGMAINFFTTRKSVRKNYYKNTWWDGSIDIVIIGLSIGMIVLLIILYRDVCLTSKRKID